MHELARDPVERDQLYHSHARADVVDSKRAPFVLALLLFTLVPTLFLFFTLVLPPGGVPGKPDSNAC